MTFQDRLKLYMIGFLIGLLLVYVLFGNRSCMSLSEIKMTQLRNQKIRVSDKVLCQLKCMHKTPSHLKAELEFFEIDFDKSSPREKPCRIYYLEPKEKFKKFYPYRIVIKDCSGVTWIYELIFQNTTQCLCS